MPAGRSDCRESGRPMKSAWWFAISELLLVLVLVLIFSGWQGNTSFALGWPASSCTINITGGTTGGRVLLAFVFLLLTVGTFVAGLARSIRRPKPVETVKA